MLLLEGEDDALVSAVGVPWVFGFAFFGYDGTVAVAVRIEACFHERGRVDDTDFVAVFRLSPAEREELRDDRAIEAVFRSGRRCEALDVLEVEVGGRCLVFWEVSQV